MPDDASLRGAIEHLTAVMQERTHRISQMMRVMLLLLLALVMVLGSSLYIQIGNRQILDEVRDTNQRIADITEPGGKAYERNQQRTAQLLAFLASENDCRDRRAEAGLPPPTNELPCESQTPEAVFPKATPATIP